MRVLYTTATGHRDLLETRDHHEKAMNELLVQMDPGERGQMTSDGSGHSDGNFLVREMQIHQRRRDELNQVLQMLEVVNPPTSANRALIGTIVRYIEVNERNRQIGELVERRVGGYGEADASSEPPICPYNASAMRCMFGKPVTKRGDEPYWAVIDGKDRYFRILEIRLPIRKPEEDKEGVSTTIHSDGELALEEPPQKVRLQAVA